MMKWAGLAFLGLIAATAWDVTDNLPMAGWIGLERPIVVLDGEKETAESDMLLLMADPNYDCLAQLAKFYEPSVENQKPAIASPSVDLTAVDPNAVDLDKDHGDVSTGNVLQDVSHSASKTAAIAMLDPHVGCMLHPRTYLLRGAPDEATLHGMAQGI
ncbi:MAG: hypothetical protein AAFY26_02600 [Cyanobacteria bacterium J06638_22]